MSEIGDKITIEGTPCMCVKESSIDPCLGCIALFNQDLCSSLSGECEEKGFIYQPCNNGPLNPEARAQYLRMVIRESKEALERYKKELNEIDPDDSEGVVSSESVYRWTIVLGDWTSEGHNCKEDYIIESNMSMYTVQELYRKSCTVYDFDFASEVCNDPGESSYLNDNAYEKLKSFGISLCEYYKEDISDLEYLMLLFQFIKLSDSNLKLTVLHTENPIFNGMECMDISFGYSLFSY